MGQLVDRMIRAARFDASLYIEVETDVTATRQALLIVLLYGICSGIGFGFADLLSLGTEYFLVRMFTVLVGAIVFWLIWSRIIYFVGTKLFMGPKTPWRSIASYGELLRSIGFSATPGILLIFAFVPFPVGGIISVVAAVWMFVASVIAVRQALDFTTGRAVGTCLVAGAFYLLFTIGLLLILLLLLPGDVASASHI
jgi:hypothetical protein